ncbi:hypothetical protein JTB14_020289 [Gonioctena quinquepunctata]|nr:hypothetical protein JTB14_020289 [Gonioctena quinquepunctata]
MNGMMRVGAPQTGPSRSVFPASTGPGPPPPQGPVSGPSPGPPPSPAAATAQGSAAKPEQAKVAASGGGGLLQMQQLSMEDRSSSPPPSKKLKTENKEVSDVCVGTSVGTITEPDCLGPCEPGTSVTLEGIVWHETEGGVLVVNVTWRGKTYVGTLLDCTRHDWAPPRFCDSPTSDLDNRTPKGRETRSSVHSKLRNGGGGAGGLKGRRGGTTNGSGPSTAPSSPAPFVPPRPETTNKRKSRVGEDEQASLPSAVKKTKVVVPPPTLPVPIAPTPCGSPPPSPVLLECPEPNCSKKYKHINGLKYHQSHAHSSADDEDTKDVTSMSENDESSNIEAPSPITPAAKSPEKSQDVGSPSTPTPTKKEATAAAAAELPLLLRGANLSEVSSQPGTPRSTPPSPATPQTIQELPPVAASSPTVPLVDSKSVVKPGVLRYTTTPEDYPVGIFSGNKAQVQGPPLANSNVLPSSRSTAVAAPSAPVDQSTNHSEPVAPPQIAPPPPQSFTNQLQQQSQSNMPAVQQQFVPQTPAIIIPNQTNNPPQLSPLPPHSPGPSANAKVMQFKVKPTSSLMPDDKKQQQQQQQQQVGKAQSFTKKKSRKSPASSPHPPAEQPMFGSAEQASRDEVQSPAYSDISDDGAPVMENDLGVDKGKSQDKKTEQGQSVPHMPQYGMYHPFYGQTHQYLVPSQQTQPDKPKEPEKQSEKVIEKEVKKETPEYPQKVVPQHYYPYGGYMPGYGYNMESNYSGVPLVQEEKIKEERIKESPSPIDQSIKQPTPIPNPIQVPTPGKTKESTHKEKHPNENHQILKESIEMKNQMNNYLYSRQPPQQAQQVQQQQQQQVQQQQQQQVQQQQAHQQQAHQQQAHQQQSQHQQQQPQQQHQHSHHNQREEDVRRYYVYSEQRRKEQQSVPEHKSNSAQNKSISLPQSPNLKAKEIKMEDKKEKEVKQEGVKPTMETQGPPPPPTSQYAYIHPSYMQQAHYGALPFDPNHPMYRGIMVPGPYSGSPYLHAPMQRYHAPEDLSRAPPPTKALDMLQHHAQYYSSHKIHELQERAIKSPTPKTSLASSSPSTNNSGGPPPVQASPQVNGPPTSQPPNTVPSSGKQTPGDNKESRSPPPQRHVHTHHHTHVGLGYPMYPAPYGAAVLASQQAAAVTVINPYPTK